MHLNELTNEYKLERQRLEIKKYLHIHIFETEQSAAVNSIVQ